MVGEGSDSPCGNVLKHGVVHFSRAEFSFVEEGRRRTCGCLGVQDRIFDARSARSGVDVVVQLGPWRNRGRGRLLRVGLLGLCRRLHVEGLEVLCHLPEAVERRLLWRGYHTADRQWVLGLHFGRCQRKSWTLASNGFGEIPRCTLVV